VNVKRKPVAVIGFAEALSAAEVAWSLVDAGFEVVGFARKGRDCALRHSRFVSIREVTPPEANAAECVEDLIEILNELSAGTESCVLMPLDDSAVLLCGRLTLPANCVSTGPQKRATDVALDKSLQLTLAKEAGFPVPGTARVEVARDLLKRATTFPMILKPAEAVMLSENRLAKGRNWICANEVELQKAAKTWNGRYALLVQPLIAGQGEGVFGIATSRGVKALSGHRRLRMMNPHGSGSSACISQPVSGELRPSIEGFVRRAGWMGLFMIELLRDAAGTAWFIEFNGRPWGSMALSRRQGLEYPAWAAQVAKDAAWDLRDPAPAERELVCRNVAREFLHLLFILRGRQSAAMNHWPSFWRSAVDVLRMSRRDRLYNFRRDDIKVFLTDCYCTIREQVFKPRQREART